MTLTKASIAKMVAAENGRSQKQSSAYIDPLIEITKRTPASGEDLQSSGFRKFQVKNKRGDKYD